MAIHDAIISAGSNWVEISSNKTNDYKWDVSSMTDGYVFKSPPIGTKNQSVVLELKSINLAVTSPSTSTGNGGNHLNIWLADDYTPSTTPNVNGTFLNRGQVASWGFTTVDSIYSAPTSLYDYFVDVLDYRILIVIQRNSATTTTYPHYLYIGYPNPTTNIEGPNYTNQFIIGSNIYCGNNTTVARVYWHKGSNALYNQYAYTNCNLNNANPNPMGLYLLSPITVTGDGGTGVSNTGPLGVLTGLYALPATNIINGDTITIGSDTYQVFNLSQWLFSSYTSIGGIATSIYYMNGISPSLIAIKTNN
ncbi:MULTISPECIES: hypothetical protein [unclassified Clostridium]|uniref:hypothetical protein n=1 Tax=unclassified Clostridium TaxID=2614128 RepID=UPI001177C021|nr:MULTISPECIES: hypothetical protein [unclassified Clostridium]